MMSAIVIGAAIGMLAGMGKAAAYSIEYDEKKKELKKTRDNLDAQYNLVRSQAEEQAGAAEKELKADIADARLAQGVGAGTAARNAVMQNEIANQQVAQLQIEGARAMGSSVQDVAMSGVRLMRDSEGNIADGAGRNTANDVRRATTQARVQAEISRSQSLEQARASYYSADRQIASYGRQIQSTKDELRRTLARMDLSYRQQRQALTDDIDYMESTTGESVRNLNIFSMLFGSTLNGASKGLGLYGEGKRYGLWG